MELDYDDHINLESMCSQSDYVIGVINKATEDMADAEVCINLAIASHDIKDSLAWKKQVIALMKVDDKYKLEYIKYTNSKTIISVNRGLLRALETRINCLKKKISTTPTI